MKILKNNSKEILTSFAILVFGALMAFAFVSERPFSVFADSETSTTTVTVGNSAPTIDDVILATNLSGGNITLVEDDGASNGFVIATTTIKISDSNGCNTISAVSATLYRTATITDGTICTSDDNSCYLEFTACAATTTGGATPQCQGGSDTDVWYDCGFKVWYLADPTADGETFAGSIWAVAATTSDSSFATTTATNSGETVEVLGLLAHNVTDTIAYGSVGSGSDTGATNSTTTITNSGNTPLDTDIGCDIMCTDYSTCGGDIIAVANQEASTSPFVWGVSGTDCTATATPATYQTLLPKPTASTSAVTDLVSWGIGIDGGQPAGSYEGQNSFDAVAD